METVKRLPGIREVEEEGLGRAQRIGKTVEILCMPF